MSMWNKATQKLFFWMNTQKDPAVGNYVSNETDSQKKVNLALLSTRDDLVKTHKLLTELKDFYLSQMMINRIIDDALNPVGSENEIFKVTIKNEDDTVNEVATKEANLFKKNFNIEKLLIDIAPDILAFGSHYLRLDVETIDSDKVLKGIINIHDDTDPTKIIPIWRDNQVLYYNVIKDNKIYKEPAYKYVFFGFSTSRKKVKVDLNDEEAVYFKTGQGILNPVIELLRTLYLLEGLVYINLLKKATKQNVLGVTIPDAVSPEEAINIAKSYEKLVNKSLNKVEFDFENIKDTLNSILENTNNVKVVPSWGDKGQLEKQEYGVYEDLEDLFTKIEDLRNVILTTNGYPEDIFNNSAGRMDIIQNSVRYSKKLKTFQTGLINSLQQLFLIHLKNQGHDISIRHIDIQFLNVVNLNDLEKVEYLSMTIDMMDTIKSFVGDIADEAEELGVKVNQKALVKYYNKSFEKLFGEPMFVVDENPDPDGE